MLSKAIRTTFGLLAMTVALAILPGAAAAGQAKPKAPRCMGERATIVGTKKADNIRGTNRADVIAGLGGNDKITGKAGADLVCAGEGRDNVLGGAESDRVAGEARPTTSRRRR